LSEKKLSDDAENNTTVASAASSKKQTGKMSEVKRLRPTEAVGELGLGKKSVSVVVQ